MQRFLSILLMCSILGQASVRTAWVLHYQWNRALYIAQCENKNKPNLNCEGQCCLKKKIAASENNGSKAPQLPDHFREIKDIQLFFETPSFPCFMVPENDRTVALPPYQIFLPDAPMSGIFRPPAA